MKYRILCLTALFAALLCLLSPLSLPAGSIPVSLGSLAVYITSIYLGKRGTLSVIVFVLLGIIGLPVFSGFRGGLDVVTGLTGGYILGYIPCAWIVGFARDKWKGKPLLLLLFMGIGTAVLYGFGSLQYALLGGIPFKTALWSGVLPFLPGDAAKMLAALFLSGRVKNIHAL
ncbi:MAG: biotin transporter BioY [Clostridia bacterium]|nr:biotin transporter BioY [Clostridia bacterium]